MPDGASEELRFDLGLDETLADPPRRAPVRRAGRTPRSASSGSLTAGPVAVAPEPRSAESLAAEPLTADPAVPLVVGDVPALVPSLPDALPPLADAPPPAVDHLEEVDAALSIASFYERVRRALAREFSEEVWVTGEIRNLRESKGHRYLELADQGTAPSGRGGAQALEVACWANSWPPIAAALAAAGVSLEIGRVVRVRGRVSIWEGAGKVRFTLTALDVEALLGGIAAARHRLLQALKAEGLLDANRCRPLSPVPLRIGIVTSPGSEGHRDFQGQLDRSGFAFEVRVEPSLVQGPEAPGQVASALRRLAGFQPDLAVVVRGGGARGDLAAFDDEQVARAIAAAPFPVWTGIGHTGDRAVADEVSHTSCITPTACGQEVVARVAAYWEAVTTRVATLSGLARAGLEAAAREVEAARRSLAGAAGHQLDRRGDQLQEATGHLARSACSGLDGEGRALAARHALLVRAARHATEPELAQVRRCREVLGAFDPSRQLGRGWSLTRRSNGRVVRSIDEIAVGERLTTRFAEGEAWSVVETLSRSRESE